MQLSFKFMFLCVFSQTVNSISAPQETLDRRAACNADNLLRLLNATSRTTDSYPYCSAYISQPPATTITRVTGTITVSASATATTTIHPLYLYNLQPFGVKTPPTPLSYSTPLPTPQTVPGGPQSYGFPPFKRDAMPTLTKKLRERQNTGSIASLVATYPASRISSACSCLSVPYSTTVTQAIAATTTVVSLKKAPYTL
jgi:hypothetical protein